MTIDPVQLAVITSAITVLATECAKKIASEAGKDLWGQIKGLFKWKEEPTLETLPRQVATELQENRELAEEIAELIKSKPMAAGPAAVFASGFFAESVVIANTIAPHGDFVMRQTKNS